MIIDTHSHLFYCAFDADLNECVERAKKNNVGKIILVGFDLETNRKALNLSKDYPNYFFNTAGIHPSEADKSIDHQFLEFEEFLQNNKVYAIGECGLDYHYGLEYKEEQKIIFERQILLSIKYSLPLIIHSRDASQDTYDMLNKYKGQIKGVMHSYSGSLEMAKRYLDLGFYISFSGVLTFKNAKEPKRVCEYVPLDHIFVETDCPYLTPSPFRGKRNESSFVKYVLEEVSKIKQIDLAKVESQLETNVYNLFKI